MLDSGVRGLRSRGAMDRAKMERRMSDEVTFILLMLPIALGVIIIGGAILVSH
jgi:hypothetical protein